MAAGRILAREILQAAADFFRVEGVKQAPAHLNLEQVLMVYDLRERGAVATPNGGQGQWDGYQISPAIAGTNAQYYQPILQGAETGQNAFRIDSIVVDILFPSTAAVTAFIAAGGTMDIVVGLKYAGGDPGHFPIVVSRMVCLSNQLEYQWALRGSNGFQADQSVGEATSHVSSWAGLVPASTGEFGNGLLIAVVSVSTQASTFPVGTTCTIYTTAREGTNGVAPVT